MEDPQEVLMEKCADLPKCSKFRDELETCNDRVNSKSKTTETCIQEVFDFVHCVDHCVSWSNCRMYMLVVIHCVGIV